MHWFILIAAGLFMMLYPRDTFRNNNPFNIRATSIKWQGENTGDGAEFESYVDLVTGARAGLVNLRTYFYQRGINTIGGIISRWAPEHENPTAEYISFVSHRAGYHPYSVMTDKKFEELLKPIALAMVRFEHGKEIDPTIIDRARAMI